MKKKKEKERIKNEKDWTKEKERMKNEKMKKKEWKIKRMQK